MKYPIMVTAIFAVLSLSSLFGANEDTPEAEISQDGAGLSTIEDDRDNDGQIDYLVKIDEIGRKVYEELDFNYDGDMDDFYYYSAGVLQRREIDTNYDTEIDVWVYIHEGVYIERYERDLDYDGEVDQVKDFSTADSVADSGK